MNYYLGYIGLLLSIVVSGEFLLSRSMFSQMGRALCSSELYYPRVGSIIFNPYFL